MSGRGGTSRIELVEGQPFEFSDFVKDYLRKQENLWQPMSEDGRPLRSLVGICVQLHEDRTILFPCLVEEEC